MSSEHCISADDWPLTRFAEFLTPNKRPYTLGPTEDADLVGMRLYGLGPFHREHKAAGKILKKTHFVVRAGDVIYNKLFAWRGSFGIVPAAFDGMYVSDKFPTYELDTSRVHPQFLAWYFQYPPLWEQARRMSTGSAALSKLTLNPPRFRDLTLPLPSPKEQRAIVSRLDAFAESLRRAQAIRDSLVPEAQALLSAIIEKRMSELSAENPMAPLSDLVDQSRGISYGIVQTGSAQEDGVLTLRAGDLRPFEVALTNVKKVERGIEAKYQRTRLTGSEVLLRIRGGLGEVAVCPSEMVGGNVSREIAVIPLDARLDASFVMYAIAAPGTQRFLRSNLRGTSYVGINLKDVRRVTLPLVSMPEQLIAVRDLDATRQKIKDLEYLQGAARSIANAALPSLLDQVFRRKGLRDG